MVMRYQASTETWCICSSCLPQHMLLSFPLHIKGQKLTFVEILYGLYTVLVTCYTPFYVTFKTTPSGRNLCFMIKKLRLKGMFTCSRWQCKEATEWQGFENAKKRCSWCAYNAWWDCKEPVAGSPLYLVGGRGREMLIKTS